MRAFDIAWGVADDEHISRIEFGVEVLTCLLEGRGAEIVSVLRKVSVSGDQRVLSGKGQPQFGAFKLDLRDLGKVSCHKPHGYLRRLEPGNELAGALQDPRRITGRQPCTGEFHGSFGDVSERFIDLCFGHIAASEQLTDDVTVGPATGVDLAEVLHDVMAGDLRACLDDGSTVHPISIAEEGAVDVEKDESGSHSQVALHGHA